MRVLLPGHHEEIVVPFGVPKDAQVFVVASTVYGDGRIWISERPDREQVSQRHNEVADRSDRSSQTLLNHPHPRAANPDVFLCTNLAVFCWLLRRRGLQGKVQDTIPALHVFGMAFLADVSEAWRQEMLKDFYSWWQTADKDIFAACQEVLSVQMWWQMGVQVPFVPLAGISRTGAAYDPPKQPKLLILRSAFWHLPAGRVFAAVTERFVAATGGMMSLVWLGRYTHTIAMRDGGPQDSRWLSFDEMARHTCALDVPAELSQMKIRDVMGIGLPLISPERTWFHILGGLW
eukprot:symbB.v1.2.012319.t1/scaffold846.1/size158211/5